MVFLRCPAFRWNFIWGLICLCLPFQWVLGDFDDVVAHSVSCVTYEKPGLSTILGGRFQFINLLSVELLTAHSSRTNKEIDAVMVSGWGYDSATSPVLSARSQCTNQNAPLLWPLHETRPSFHYPAENSICVSRSIFYPLNARTGLKILSLNPCVGGRFLFSLGCVGFAPPPSFNTTCFGFTCLDCS